MGTDVNITHFPNVTNCEIDIGKIFSSEKMKPSSITEEELLENRRTSDEKKAKYDAAVNYWAGLYSATNSSEITLDANSKVSAVAISNDYTFTDPQFITNFVAKESFYEDTLKERYSGKELEEKLSELDKVSNEVINKLSESFAKGIGNFLNGDQGWLNQELSFTASSENNQANFNVKEFQNHIVDVIKDEKKLFDNIKAQNSEEWKQVINNYGDGLEKFTTKLDSLSSLNLINEPNKIENMSYRDIKAVGTVIDALGGGIYTNSAEILGAYLGQMKLKGDIMLENCDMSSKIKKILSNAISQDIARKIVTFSNSDSAIGEASFGVLEGKVVDSFNSFSKLYNTDIQQFRIEYSKSLNELLNSLTEKTSYEAESPYTNKVRFANSIINQQVNDWNDFLDKLKINTDTKKCCYINGFSGNIIDSKS